MESKSYCENKLNRLMMPSIFLSTALAFSIVIVSVSNSFNSSLFDYMFGSIVAVSDEDIVMIVCFFIEFVFYCVKMI